VFNALSDFIIFCRVERRLAELTCTAYERDVRACLDFLRGQGIAALAEIRTPDLQRFLAEEATHRPAARGGQAPAVGDHDRRADTLEHRW
jgi:site-specific recombinase XerD